MKVNEVFDPQSRETLLFRQFERLHAIWFNTSKFSPQSAIARAKMDETWQAYQAEKQNPIGWK